MSWKRFGKALWFSIRMVVPIVCTLQAIIGGIIEYCLNKSFYTYIFEKNFRWILCLVLLFVAIVIMYFVALQKKYPDFVMKEAVNVLPEKRLYFFKANDNIERDSVIEIRKKLETRKHGNIAYAIAFVDRYDDNNPNLMIAQHVALYKDGTYVNKIPIYDIEIKNAKNYYYRPYLSHNEFRRIGLER